MWEKLKESVPNFCRGIVVVRIILLLIAGVIGIFILEDIDRHPEFGFTMAFLILLGVTVILLCLHLACIVSGYFYFAACDKGYEEHAYLYIVFFLGAVGMLLVIALPDKNNATLAVQKINNPKSESQTVATVQPVHAPQIDPKHTGTRPQPMPVKNDAIYHKISAPIPGNVIQIPIQIGDTVNEGDTVCILECMKMTNEIKASQRGTVKAIHVEVGEILDTGDTIITLQ